MLLTRCHPQQEEANERLSIFGSKHYSSVPTVAPLTERYHYPKLARLAKSGDYTNYVSTGVGVAPFSVQCKIFGKCKAGMRSACRCSRGDIPACSQLNWRAQPAASGVARCQKNGTGIRARSVRRRRRSVTSSKALREGRSRPSGVKLPSRSVTGSGNGFGEHTSLRIAVICKANARFGRGTVCTAVKRSSRPLDALRLRGNRARKSLYPV